MGRFPFPLNPESAERPSIETLFGHVKVGLVDQADLEEARRLMQLEYETAQGSIANFDGHRFRIKEWAVTVAGALLALAVDSHSWSLGVIATTAVLFFAYIEIIYMEIQHRVINRSNHLEKCKEAARRGDVPTHTPSELEVFSLTNILGKNCQVGCVRDLK